jgi:hypothetical protein
MMTLPLDPADEAQLVASLQQWRDEGNPNPLIPIGDLDGDGFTDSWGLSESGGLIVVFGTPLEQTVYAADGGGIETDREEQPNG